MNRKKNIQMPFEVKGYQCSVVEHSVFAYYSECGLKMEQCMHLNDFYQISRLWFSNYLGYLVYKENKTACVLEKGYFHQLQYKNTFSVLHKVS